MKVVNDPNGLCLCNLFKTNSRQDRQKHRLVTIQLLYINANIATIQHAWMIWC